MSTTGRPAGPAVAPTHRRQLRSGLVSAGVLSILLGGLVLAIPGLGTAGGRGADAEWGWVALAAGLELASCAGYVLAFQGIFREVPGRFAALVATAEQAFGAVVPVGGAGGIAAGGWLLARAQMPVRLIAERSAVLFLLTSATNVVTLALAGTGLAIGVLAGPHDLALSALPAGVGFAVLAVFIGLALGVARHTSAGSSRRSRAVEATARASATTLLAIRRPGWRLTTGALAYLLFDVAALWLAIHALGYDVPVAPLLLAYLIGYLANAIPIPGGLGVLDGGLAGALILYHTPASVAIGGVLLYHALALWIPAVSGTVGFLGAQRQLNSGRVRIGPAPAVPAIDPGVDAAPAPSEGLRVDRRSVAASPRSA
jgi:uncharacterized membrane protein YbhN (UPF0104 family)